MKSYYSNQINKILRKVTMSIVQLGFSKNLILLCVGVPATKFPSKLMFPTTSAVYLIESCRGH